MAADRWNPTPLAAQPNAPAFGRCDHCPRTVPSDQLVSLLAVPSAFRPAPRAGASAALWACDACRESMIKRALISRAGLARVLGAPPECVARAIAKRTALGDRASAPEPP